jgi:hypothetical protein
LCEQGIAGMIELPGPESRIYWLFASDKPVKWQKGGSQTLISSEVILTSSEENKISSEETWVSSEEKLFSSEENGITL